MSRITDDDLIAGLRQRKKTSVIEKDLESSIVTQMQSDAMRISMDGIHPSPYQVRQLNEQAIEEMMESIRNTGGLITPVIVRPISNGYELVTGHTRYLAYQKLGYTEIPAVIRVMNDCEASKALAADNLSRKDLYDYEVFKTLNYLMMSGYVKSNSEASRLLGRTRQDIIRYLSFGKLPQTVTDFLELHPAILGADAAKKLLEFVPQYTDTVLDGLNKLQSGQIKTQVSLLMWIKQQTSQKIIKNDRSILDLNGNVIGKYTRTENGIKIISKSLDLTSLEEKFQEFLTNNGFKI